ncbi:hypothetical protein BDF14DRAFT_1755064 [Spinellus fusiger]|nr:hypothetical protein BDF14DRAFT_1755064 [Spinellus fusiger]
MGKKGSGRNTLETEDFVLEEGSSQNYARSLGPRGNHQHQVEYADGTQTLVVLPPKFRNTIWVKRGHYVIVDPMAGTTSDKVGGEIIQVLFPQHIKWLKQAGKWPDHFDRKEEQSEEEAEAEEVEEEEEEEEDDLFVNNNRPIMSGTESEEESEEEDSEEEETKGISH